MDFRHTMKGRRALSTVAITTGLLLTVAGCGGGGSGKSDKGSSTSSSSATKSNGGTTQSKPPESTAAPLAEVKGSGLVLTVTSAKRDGGGFVTVEGTVTNNTSALWVAAEWLGDERELARNGGSIAGASLIDQKGKKKYLILRDTSGRCLCTQFTGGVRQGATADWFAQFPAPPADTTNVDFQVGSMPPASIQISDGE
ncbi:MULTISPECIES: hypothetical protein [Streptomyces]|uniref:Lipoprotein n=1 Tax=Streptomyces mirabilis TaxID=68239 RepID=A0ABU3ULM3_9ACTN|nr:MULTISPECIES: hypothetical protein [Streptomyces]MDU8994825.1 hypothetical protein [Streptomyces mirabilis]QDN89872.1 hypothetical protein FNV61_33825 [Streptomyces sp. RLB3-6]QDO10719.1 hypothetical protein FNV68_34995 [Streptomyces sp. S1D4-23]